METLFLFALQRSLLTGIVILFILLIRWMFFERLSPQTRHGLWFFLLPVLLLPTSIVPIPVVSYEKTTDETNKFSLPAIEAKPMFSELKTPSPTREEIFSSVITSVPISPENIDSPIVFLPKPTSKIHLPSLFFLLITIWLLGIAILSVLSFTQVLRLRYKFLKAKEITDENILSILDQCKKTMNIRSSALLVESGRILCPALIGVVKPRIVLPSGFAEQHSEERLSHLLCHELAHLKRRDILTGWLTSLMCFVHWFNPLIWFAVRKMNDDAEEAADQLVMQTLDRQHRIKYGRTLLSLAERYYSDNRPKILHHVPGFVGLMESSTQLSRRIEMIEKHDTWHRGWMFFAIFLCLAVSATALIRVQRVEAKTTETEKSESSPQKTQGDSEEREGDSFGDLTWLKVSGKIVAPEKIAFDKFDIKAVGHSVLNPNRSGSGDTRVDEDGTFSGDIWADYDYGFFFNDPNLQWAAKPVFMTVGKESPKEKVVITLEKGSLVEATLLDRETGKPISGMTVWLTQDIEWKDSRSAHKTFSNSELLRTDENGQIKCCVTPGDFRFTVDMPNFSWEDGERLYSLDFTVKKGENAKPLLKIPPPFLGKVLDENGEPVVDARVAVHGPTMDFLYTDTDKDGFFKRRTAPKSSLIEIVKRKGKNKETTFVGWVKDELKNDEIWTVTLREGETVTGRLLDAATGKPLAKSLLFYQYENPKNSKQKEFLASSARTDAEGYFKATGLNPGLNYRFFFVPGRTREYNGGPYSPRVELAFLKTDKPGETVDLGDLKVDPNQAESDPQDELADEFSKRIEEGFSDLLTGKKKGGFILIAASDDDKAVEQILSYRNDLRFGSLVFFTVKRSEIPEQFLGQLDERDGRYPLLFAVGNPKRESPPTPVFLDELRGEKDSSWNVPNDDPSNSGDWKKTPGMVNPKIFDNFLNDYLKKID